MTLARLLLNLWRLRLWVGIGVLLSGGVAVGSIAMSHPTVYSSASTQMLIDSPQSALANAGVDLTGYIARADVFARLMTSDEAVQYIGKAAGIHGSSIDVTGPMEINGSPTATHAPVDVVGGRDLPAPALYKLSLVQNPSLPTVDVYAEAPTTAKAIALANGAVTGFAAFVNHLDSRNVPSNQRIEVRQLGPATGGVVDPSAGKSIAALLFVGIFALWCWLVLVVSRLLPNLRAAKRSGLDDPVVGSEEPLAAAMTPPAADMLPIFTPHVDSPHAEAGAPHTNGKSLQRPWATTRIDQRP